MCIHLGHILNSSRHRGVQYLQSTWRDLEREEGRERKRKGEGGGRRGRVRKEREGEGEEGDERRGWEGGERGR